MFRLVKGLKLILIKLNMYYIYRGSDGKLCFSEMKRGRVWKGYMERIMNEKMIGIIMWKEMQ